MILKKFPNFEPKVQELCWVSTSVNRDKFGLWSSYCVCEPVARPKCSCASDVPPSYWFCLQTGFWLRLYPSFQSGWCFLRQTWEWMSSWGPHWSAGPSASKGNWCGIWSFCGQLPVWPNSAMLLDLQWFCQPPDLLLTYLLSQSKTGNSFQGIPSRQSTQSSRTSQGERQCPLDRLANQMFSPVCWSSSKGYAWLWPKPCHAFEVSSSSYLSSFCRRVQLARRLWGSHSGTASPTCFVRSGPIYFVGSFWKQRACDYLVVWFFSGEQNLLSQSVFYGHASWPCNLMEEPRWLMRTSFHWPQKQLSRCRTPSLCTSST